MKKSVILSGISLLWIVMLSSCTTMSTSESNDYFGYNNEPKIEKQEVVQVNEQSSTGSADYYDYNSGTSAVSGSPIVERRTFVYYDYYNPYRTSTFIPWSNYYYDPYYDDFVSMRIYYGPRYNRYYWDDWDYYYYRGYPYWHHGYHNNYYDWTYYNRYYNRHWNNYPVYVEPERKRSTRNFGPSRGTYGGYDDVELRNPRSTDRNRTSVRDNGGDIQSIYNTGTTSRRSAVRPTVESVDNSPNKTNQRSNSRDYRPEEYRSGSNATTNSGIIESNRSRTESARPSSSGSRESYRAPSSSSSRSTSTSPARSSSSPKSSGSSRSSGGSSNSRTKTRPR